MGLFQFSDRIDKLLMFVGGLATIGEGLAAPLTLYVTSGSIDAFGSTGKFIGNEVVDKVRIARFSTECRTKPLLKTVVCLHICSVFVQYGLRLLYLALGVGFICFFGMSFVMINAE